MTEEGGMLKDRALEDAWILAMRDPETKQITGLLRSRLEECCLGVLCRVAKIPVVPNGATCEGADEKSGQGYDPIKTLFKNPRDMELCWKMNDHIRMSLPDIAGQVEARREGPQGVRRPTPRGGL